MMSKLVMKTKFLQVKSEFIEVQEIIIPVHIRLQIRIKDHF